MNVKEETINIFGTKLKVYQEYIPVKDDFISSNNVNNITRTILFKSKKSDFLLAGRVLFFKTRKPKIDVYTNSYSQYVEFEDVEWWAKKED